MQQGWLLAELEAGMRVLIVGGSGYLGQFLLQSLAKDHEVVYTYKNSSNIASLPGESVPLDLTDAAQAVQLVETRGPFGVVINTAAISQPGLCEQNTELARRVNVPHALLDALNLQRARQSVEALLIHLSTDQVYDGSKANWTEDCETKPINAYGRSKLEAEQVIQARWSSHVILRSSIIFGPQSPVPVPRPLFVQFLENALRLQQPTKLFHDEYRNPIYVGDIVRVVGWLVESRDAAALRHCCLNMGGPDRLSRVGMARAVAAHCGLDTGCIEEVASATVARAAASPLDISMDSSRLAAELPFPLTPFRAALAEVFPSDAPMPP